MCVTFNVYTLALFVIYVSLALEPSATSAEREKKNKKNAATKSKMDNVIYASLRVFFTFFFLKQLKYIYVSTSCGTMTKIYIFFSPFAFKRYILLYIAQNLIAIR